MARTSEDSLSRLHGMVGSELAAQLQSDCPKERLAAVDRAMRFLKDNNITSTVGASVPLQEITAAMPSREELERLMEMSPD